MPQSRNRRPSKTSEQSRKAPADYVTNNVREKETSKIPRNIRYDLENALLGLCDVWFEEIKPHLVKNKLKLHTGGALNENGYSDLEPAREPRRDGRAQLDPGAASDTRHRAAAISRAYSPTRPEASKAPCPKPPLRTCPTSPTNLHNLPQTRRRPTAISRVNLPARPEASKAPCPKPPLRTYPTSPTDLRKLLQLPEDNKMQPPIRRVTAREHSPPTLAKNYPWNVHELSKPPLVQKTPLQRPPAPPLTQTGKTHQRTVPNSSKRMLEDMGTRPRGRRVLMPLPSPSQCTFTLYPQNIPNNKKKKASSNRKKRKRARTHRTTQIPSSSVPPPKRVARPCCTACALVKAQTVPIPQLPVAKFTPSKPPSNNKATNFPRWPAPESKFPHKFPTRDCAVFTDLPFYTTSISPAGDIPLSLVAEHPSSASKFRTINSRYDHARTAISPSRFRQKSPFLLHGARLLPPPLHAKCLAPPEHPMASPRESQPVSRTLAHAPSTDERWFLRVIKEYTRSQNQTKPPLSPIKEPTLPCHDTKSSRRTITIQNENKLLLEDKRSLFSKELVDLIGNKYDERLRVLYETPCRQESQSSVLCLVGSRKKRMKCTPKKMPWK
ncbi:serine/arginine repetitive matrix protein 1-like [Cydia splendana]|uniref:serine/arginine repetitive matrix protein 1-like n=1 Tax=Cydia splendana TaxID=1100963 RepID=UPI00300C6C90